MKFDVPLDLSVEVWFGHGSTDLLVAVLTDKANDLVTAKFTWDELMDALDYEEPLESLREQARLEVANHKKAILRRMKTFVREKGFALDDAVEKRAEKRALITLRTPEPQLLRLLNGCLKSSIDAHGPITHETRNSAAKRIAKQFLTVENAEEQV